LIRISDHGDTKESRKGKQLHPDVLKKVQQLQGDPQLQRLPGDGPEEGVEQQQLQGDPQLQRLPGNGPEEGVEQQQNLQLL